MMQRIFLLGFMGSGKSTLGKKLASKLSFSFIDMDVFIENKEGISISEIFTNKGESYFRELERKALLELCEKQNVVISTGGGTPCFYDNSEIINKNGFSIYLKLNPEILVGRLKNETNKRPLLANLTGEELRLQISEKLALREPYYQKAKLIFTSHSSANRDVQLLLLELKKNKE